MSTPLTLKVKRLLSNDYGLCEFESREGDTYTCFCMSENWFPDKDDVVEVFDMGEGEQGVMPVGAEITQQDCKQNELPRIKKRRVRMKKKDDRAWKKENRRLRREEKMRKLADKLGVAYLSEEQKREGGIVDA